MKLDPRIKSLPDILTCFDIEKAEQFIGQKGYFADDLPDYDSLENGEYGTLTEVLDNEDPFKVDNRCYWRFFIPECSLKPKEKQYRPYTLNEFLDKYIVCANIRIRQRDRACQYFGKLIGYEFPTDPNTGKQKGDNDAIVCIGGYNFKLIELFNDYEQYDNMKDIWVPCGVEVKE